MFPSDLKFPMVAPADLGRAAANRLVEPFSGDTDVHLVEGPARYSVRDVAEAFGKVFGRRVEVRSLPPSEWLEAYQELGCSEPAARLYAAMTRATIEGAFPAKEETERGTTSLQSYVEALVNRPQAYCPRSPSAADDEKIDCGTLSVPENRSVAPTVG